MGTKDETRRNRDKWRGVRDVMEIEQTGGWRRYSGGEAVWDGLVGDPLVI